MNQKLNDNQRQILTIDPSKLPLIIEFQGADGIKEYILKDNKVHTSILLNKKEY